MRYGGPSVDPPLTVSHIGVDLHDPYVMWQGK